MKEVATSDGLCHVPQAVRVREAYLALRAYPDGDAVAAGRYAEGNYVRRHATLPWSAA